MARKKRRKVNDVVRQRRLDGLAIKHILRSEPVIRVFDRRADYQARVRVHQESFKKGVVRKHQVYAAPGRIRRRLQAMSLRRMFPDSYEQMHNCTKEWRKLLSWRSSQGSGSRKRSKLEMNNNRNNFKRRDC